MQRLVVYPPCCIAKDCLVAINIVHINPCGCGKRAVKSGRANRQICCQIPRRAVENRLAVEPGMPHFSRGSYGCVFVVRATVCHADFDRVSVSGNERCWISAIVEVRDLIVTQRAVIKSNVVKRYVGKTGISAACISTAKNQRFALSAG